MGMSGFPIHPQQYYHPMGMIGPYYTHPTYDGEEGELSEDDEAHEANDEKRKKRRKIETDEGKYGRSRYRHIPVPVPVSVRYPPHHMPPQYRGRVQGAKKATDWHAMDPMNRQGHGFMPHMLNTYDGPHMGYMMDARNHMERRSPTLSAAGEGANEKDCRREDSSHDGDSTRSNALLRRTEAQLGGPASRTDDGNSKPRKRSYNNKHAPLAHVEALRQCMTSNRAGTDGMALVRFEKRGTLNKASRALLISWLNSLPLEPSFLWTEKALKKELRRLGMWKKE
jgi:hypothetical protein